MRRMKPLIRLSCCALLALPAVPAVEVPAVPVIEDRQALAVVVVPDLAKAIANLEATCQAAKLPLPPGMLAMQAGGLIGDPGLTAIAGKPIVVAVAPGMPIPSWCAILPIADATALAPLTASGNAVAEAVPGGIAVGSAVGGIDLAKRIAPAVPALAKAVPAGVDLRALIATDRLAQTYLPLLGGLMQQGLMQQARLQGKADDPAEKQKAQAIVALLRAGLGQAGPACIDLASTPTGWRLDMLSGVAPGPIADAVKPLPAGTAALLPRIPAGASPATMAIAGRIPPAIYTGLGKLLEQARKDPAVAKLVDPTLVQMIAEAARIFDGRMAMRQGADGNPFQQLGAIGIVDPAAAAQLLARIQALAGAGGIADLLAASGLKLEWQAKARMSGAIPVDRLTYTPIPGKMQPMQEQLMQEVLKPQDMALGAGVLAYGAPPAEVDQLLTGKPAAKALALRAQELPGSWDLHADWDLALQMKQQFAIMAKQMPMMGQMFQQVKGGDPVRIGLAFGDARMRTLVVVPAAMVAELASAKPARGGPGAEPEAAPAPPANEKALF